jgi:hypothetical protein
VNPADKPAYTRIKKIKFPLLAQLGGVPERLSEGRGGTTRYPLLHYLSTLPLFLLKTMEFQADSATFAAKIKVQVTRKQATRPFLILVP